MIQVYFLSILFNAVTGFLLISDSTLGQKTIDKDEGDSVLKSMEETLHLSAGSATFRLILGALTFLTGLLKLLLTMDGRFPVFGDLIPALAGLSTGLILLFDFYKSHTDMESEKVTRINVFIEKNKIIFGGFAVAAALLHFVFPSALLL
jgi:hypothetical protein